MSRDSLTRREVGALPCGTQALRQPGEAAGGDEPLRQEQEPSQTWRSKRPLRGSLLQMHGYLSRQRVEPGPIGQRAKGGGETWEEFKNEHEGAQRGFWLEAVFKQLELAYEAPPELLRVLSPATLAAQDAILPLPDSEPDLLVTFCCFALGLHHLLSSKGGKKACVVATGESYGILSRDRTNFLDCMDPGGTLGLEQSLHLLAPRELVTSLCAGSFEDYAYICFFCLEDGGGPTGEELSEELATRLGKVLKEKEALGESPQMLLCTKARRLPRTLEGLVGLLRAPTLLVYRAKIRTNPSFEDRWRELEILLEGRTAEYGTCLVLAKESCKAKLAGKLEIYPFAEAVTGQELEKGRLEEKGADLLVIFSDDQGKTEERRALHLCVSAILLTSEGQEERASGFRKGDRGKRRN